MLLAARSTGRQTDKHFRKWQFTGGYFPEILKNNAWISLTCRNDHDYPPTQIKLRLRKGTLPKHDLLALAFPQASITPLDLLNRLYGS